ncbi:MAG: hypothetical protein JO007_10505 [Alphaproteobacteria bacterium]|nr:hypothetical protein [Alphaproteobacteria bacterium]
MPRSTCRRANPGPRTAAQEGRPPTLVQVLADPVTVWPPVSITGWYGTPKRRLAIGSQTAVGFHRGLPPVPLRWVLLRDPRGNSTRRRCGASIPAARPCRSSAGLSSAGPLRSLPSLSKGREARDHLGLETQRPWSDRAIARTTSCRRGLVSLTARLGCRLSTHTKRAVAAAAWYRKTQPTFADTLAAVRQEIWAAQGFSISRTRSDSRKLPSRLRKGIATASIRVSPPPFPD